jgi:thiosulfate/3-mercaptopyruvate sulfurtransferase
LREPDAFAAAMGRVRIGDETTVIAYDDSGGGTAGRLVWMLRVLGRRAALLDGGLASMPDEREAGPTPAVAPLSFTARPWPASAMATADELAAHIDAGGVALDARSAERFRGENDRRLSRASGRQERPWTRLGRPAGSAAADRATTSALGPDPTPRSSLRGSGVSACADIPRR